MKMLYRDSQGDYKWGVVDNSRYYNGYYDKETGERVRESDVLKVKNSIYNKYVYCSKCYKPIRNTEDAIEKHFRTEEAKANCLKCDRIGYYSENLSNANIKRNSDGTYSKVIKETGYLYCRDGYSSVCITDTERIHRYCKYYAHRNQGIRHYPKHFLDIHPNAFDVFITEKALIDNGWILEKVLETDRTYRYKNHTWYAYVDNNGIINKFAYNGILFTYSHKYNRFFSIVSGQFRNLYESDFPITLLKVIRKMYESL